MAETKDKYVEDLKAQLDKWSAQIDEIEAKAKQSSAEAQQEYQQQLDDLRKQRDEAQKKLTELQASGDAAWDDMKDGLQSAWANLSKSVDDAMARFR